MRIESTIGHRLSAIGRRVRQLFGMPDYQRYLEHHSRCHAGQAAMTEKEFVRVELERKYAGSVGRCC
jgi:uncharacterized short protein YbdD (DUF466 family)